MNPFKHDLRTIDSAVADLIAYESERQARKLILIPSESPMPLAVQEAIGSVFENIYAEGYPDPRMRGLPEESILDYEMQMASYRRNSDRRRSKGVEYVDILETLACRRAAEAFATPSVPAERIWANVQPLSGSPANNAVYSALLPLGSTIMGMDQMHGGHHTHGSPDNRSGQLYHALSYAIDEETERLNYDAIEKLARKHKPKLIIAGYTSYPWMPDWARFRQIADAVGAYLLADISHVAGMVAAGVVPSPIGHAHVVTFTTHKTLYGPRGACILTTNKALADKIDAAVFPGEQGGPHVSAMAGMAVIFKLARQPEFVELQRQIVRNAKHMAAELERRGLRIPYGGTDTHMILVDCRTIRAQTGVSPDGKRGTPLMGDPAARLLDLAGVVVNPNALPGDQPTAAPSGIRLGTPWITQRGFREPHIERLADIMARVLQGTRPHALAGRQGPIYHAKVDFDLLEQAKWDVVELARSVDLPQDYTPSGYPHHYFLHGPISNVDVPWDVIEIEGPHARGFCNVVMTNDVYALKAGECQQTWILEPDGRLMGAGVLKRPGPETTRFQVLVRKSEEPRVANWMRALSDGFVDADPRNVFMKAPGPVVVRRLPHELAENWEMLPAAPAAFEDGSAGWAMYKPYWIGNVLSGPAGSPFLDGFKPLPSFEWQEPADQPLRRTPLYDLHKAAGAKIAPFAGWEMPLQYTTLLE